jgi:hypothetical protein
MTGNARAGSKAPFPDKRSGVGKDDRSFFPDIEGDFSAMRYFIGKTKTNGIRPPCVCLLILQ